MKIDAESLLIDFSNYIYFSPSLKANFIWVHAIQTKHNW